MYERFPKSRDDALQRSTRPRRPVCSFAVIDSGGERLPPRQAATAGTRYFARVVLWARSGRRCITTLSAVSRMDGLGAYLTVCWTSVGKVAA